MLSTSFTKLTGCRVAIQLAPMPIVTLELASAVAEAGGLAMLSALRAPTPYLVDTVEKASRGGGAIGVNFVIPFLNRETLKAVATRVKVVEFFFGDPDPALVELVHTAGALACWHVGSVEEAVVRGVFGCCSAGDSERHRGRIQEYFSNG